MIVLSVLLLAAAAVMIPFGLASDQGEGLIWASVACTALALILLAVGVRRQARSGSLASVPPWALPEPEPPARSAADTAVIEASGDGEGGGAETRDAYRRPSTAKRVGVKRAAGARTKKAAVKKAAGTKKTGAKKAAGAKKTGAKKTGGRKASGTKKA